MKRKQRQMQKPTQDTRRARAEYLFRELKRAGYELLPVPGQGILIRKAA